MNQIETTAHHLLARLRYLLARLEGEFFHLQPDLQKNGAATSLALCSILNEAVNVQEAAFSDDFFPRLKVWGSKQTWSWNDVAVRFTWWPVCESIKPFRLDSDGNLYVAGRNANNDVKHQGGLACLRDAVDACAATWFLVMESAREAKIFLSQQDADRLFMLFDCFDLIEARESSYAYMIGRPLHNRVGYPLVRGESEIEIAQQAFQRRSAKGSD